ncbi:AAA family ATPase [Pseudanabaena sp. ABRG5-3]|uniref:AAA family ATPase n=1 Tax=Pseudanabaena sp. ABRG5-3 TaxID=685565 RepID=UPI000DC735D7|nr:AAA family ATPase [Pseudanabaena sp. ABRG5-3]BBC24815.1 ATPase AAA [Pseudanabaena sp. ABRG5-3]
MTNRNLENITIHQFRGLKELELKDLGQINLLVGVNNSGKTSVLEALSIYCDPLDLRGWISTARQREEIFSSSRTLPLDALRWLFNKDIPHIGTIFISGDGDFAVKRIKAVYEDIEGMFFPEKRKQFIHMNDPINGDDEDDQVIEEEEEVRKGLDLQIELYDDQLMLFDEQAPVFSGKYQLWENDFLLSKKSTKKEFKLPISIVTPTSHRSNIGQIRLLSDASFYNFKSDVLALLMQMDQNISDIEILLPPESTSSRINIYIQHKKLGLVPLSSFGDGVRRLLHIALKLASVKGGILLIDELESTIHTEALQNSFQWLAKWSKEMNVQIFATTHSLEAIDSLLAVNHESLDLVLYRLEPKENQTKVVRHDWTRLKRLRENLGMEVR